MIDQEPNYPLRRAVVAGAAIVGGAAIATGVVAATQGGEKAPDSKELSFEHVLSPKEAAEIVDGMYPAESVIGEIKVVYGTRLFDEASAQVRALLGDEEYLKQDGTINNVLLPTTQVFTSQAGPHPGDVLATIGYDLNDDGKKEYFTVDISHVVQQAVENGQIPSPTQAPAPEVTDVDLPTLNQ
jgi:hypothetical protein